MGHEDVVDLRVEVGGPFDLETYQLVSSGPCQSLRKGRSGSGESSWTDRLSEVQNRLARNERLLRVIPDLKVDHMDRAVILSSSRQQI